jgi:hypothetical protein
MSKVEIGAKVSVDTSSAQKSVSDLQDEIAQLRQEVEKTTEGTDEHAAALKRLADAEKKAEKQTDSLNKELKDNDKANKDSKKSGSSFLDTLKAFSIVGAVSSAFSFLSSKLMENQKVADAVSAVMSTISTIIGKLVDIVISVTSKVGESSNGFEALKKTMMGFLTLALTPIKVAFYEIGIAIGYVQLAWEKLFGDSSQANIDKINERINNAKQGLLETAQNAVQAGKDIYNNFGDAVSQVSDVVTGVVDEASKINVKAIYESSKATIALKNTAKLAAADLQGLVEKYDRMAEQQRQIRDDESKSIEERIAANNKLGQILDEQSKAMLNLADTKIAAAKAELQGNSSNLDLQVALKDAINERAGILAQITGLESEQKVNAVALNKELLEMNKAVAESDAKIALEKRKAAAELIQDELKKQIELQAIRDKERTSEIARLQENINNTTAGTQARVDAEIALKEKIAELDIADAEGKKQIDNIKLQREKDLTAAKNENALTEYSLKKALLEQEKIDAFAKAQKMVDIAKQETAEVINQLHQKRDAEIAAAEAQGLDTTQIKQKYALQEAQINAAVAKSEEDLAAAKKKAQLDAADGLADTLTKTSQLLGEQTKAGKAMAVAAATIATFSSAVKAYDATVGIPFVGPVLAPINAALAVAAGLANVKKILAVKAPGVSGGGSVPSAGGMGGGGAASAPIAPMSMPSTTSLSGRTLSSMNATASRAYVVEADIANNQDRISRINRAARIG